MASSHMWWKANVANRMRRLGAAIPFLCETRYRSTCCSRLLAMCTGDILYIGTLHEEQLVSIWKANIIDRQEARGQVMY